MTTLFPDDGARCASLKRAAVIFDGDDGDGDGVGSDDEDADGEVVAVVEAVAVEQRAPCTSAVDGFDDQAHGTRRRRSDTHDARRDADEGDDDDDNDGGGSHQGEAKPGARCRYHGGPNAPDDVVDDVGRRWWRGQRRPHNVAQGHDLRGARGARRLMLALVVVEGGLAGGEGGDARLAQVGHRFPPSSLVSDNGGTMVTWGLESALARRVRAR